MPSDEYQTYIPPGSTPVTGSVNTPVMPSATNLQSTAPRTVDLGNGSSLVSYYDPYLETWRSQVVSNRELPQGAQGDPQLAQRQAFEAAQNQIALAERQRQFNEQFGMDKARGDQQQQIAQGNLQLGQSRLGEDQRQFDAGQALNYYKYLSELASNPRNFVQSLFAQRGQVAPAAANGQGNVDAIQRYLPFLLGGAQTQTQAAPNTATVRMQPYLQDSPMAQPANRFAGGVDLVAQTNARQGMPQSAPAPMPRAQMSSVTTTPTTIDYGQMAGQTVNTPTQALSNGQTATLAYNAPVTQSGIQANEDAANGVARVTDPFGNERTYGGGQYAKGGIIPEPVVGRGVVSGQPYTFGEKGPEAVIPSNMLPKFLEGRHGKTVDGTRSYALGGDLGYDSSGWSPANPYEYPDYTSDYGPPTYEQFIANPGNYGGSVAPEPMGPVAATPTDGYATDPYGVGAYTGGGFSVGHDYVAETNQLVSGGGGPYEPSPTGGGGTSGGGAAEPTNPFGEPIETPTTPGATPVAVPSTPVAVGGGGPYKGGPIGAEPTADPSQYIPQFVRPPVSQPQGNGTYSGSLGGVTPADVAPPGTFNSQSQSQPLPTYLPGEDSGIGGVLAQLRSLNAVPPFLTRLFAQSQGDASQGTNIPQPNTLPKDVPLISSMAYSQMNPSEQQALLSYVSAYGVTPDDYLAMIRANSPQGGTAQAPLFGNRFAYSRNQA